MNTARQHQHSHHQHRHPQNPPRIQADQEIASQAECQTKGQTKYQANRKSLTRTDFRDHVTVGLPARWRIKRLGLLITFSLGGLTFTNSAAIAHDMRPPLIAATPSQEITPPTAASREPMLDKSQPFSFYGHWDTDLVNNLGGGIRTGSAVDSVAVGGFTLKGDRFGLPRSLFNLSVMGTRVGNADARFIGATTNPSNIEGNRNRLVLNTALWQQNWLTTPHLGINSRLGMFDLNSEFDGTDNAAQLLNSSFGLDPTLTDNFAASTFPKNGTGLVVGIGNAANPDTAPFALKVGLIQGDVDQQTSPFSEGVLNIAEGQWRPDDNTAIKLGGWQKRGHGQPSLHGGYLSAESTLIATDKTNISGFIRASFASGMAPQTAGTSRYWGAGINWQAPFANRPNDFFTFGAASLRASQNGQYERLIEVAYIARITSRIYLQPDLQYIHNPGTNQPNALPNAWVAILRLHIE